MFERFADWVQRYGIRVVFGGVAVFVMLLGAFYLIYTQFRIDVPAYHIAVLTHKVGKEIPNDREIAPDETYKGLQEITLDDGRYYYNPINYSWDVVPQIEIPAGKLGVRIRLYGDDLGYGKIIAEKPTDKGIVREVLKPGRHSINAILVDGETKQVLTPRDKDNYVEIIELHDPITIPAGYRGIVTLLQEEMPSDPNVLLVEAGKRGPQEKSLEEGTRYLNPYITRVNLIDTRSQRYNMGDASEIMGFPSRDGFWVVLEGIIEFKVKPEAASNVYVMYNDSVNGDQIDEEIIHKIILPNARSFCRMKGSDHAGKEFISGDTRMQFQQDFQKAMEDACEPLGIDIIQALITRIKPPEDIAEPIRDREVAEQTALQYVQQTKQQEAEQKLAIEQELIAQKQELVNAEQDVVKVIVAAQRQQEVDITKAKENLAVAEFKLSAAKDEATAVVARGQAAASVVEFDNEASAAGWRAAVAAFDNNGANYAKYVLYQKLAPGFQSIMVNTSDSPLMQIFEDFRKQVDAPAQPNQPIVTPVE